MLLTITSLGSDELRVEATEDGKLWLKENFTEAVGTVNIHELWKELLSATGYTYVEPKDIRADNILRAILATGVSYYKDGTLHINPKARMWGMYISGTSPALLMLARGVAISFTKI